MKIASAILARGHGEGAISMQSLGKRWGGGTKAGNRLRFKALLRWTENLSGSLELGALVNLIRK